MIRGRRAAAVHFVPAIVGCVGRQASAIWFCLSDPLPSDMTCGDATRLGPAPGRARPSRAAPARPRPARSARSRGCSLGLGTAVRLRERGRLDFDSGGAGEICEPPGRAVGPGTAQAADGTDGGGRARQSLDVAQMRTSAGSQTANSAPPSMVMLGRSAPAALPPGTGTGSVELSGACGRTPARTVRRSPLLDGAPMRAQRAVSAARAPERSGPGVRRP